MPAPALIALLMRAGPLLAGEGGGGLAALLGGGGSGAAGAAGSAGGAAGAAGRSAEFGGLLRGVLQNVGKDVTAQSLTDMLFGGGEPAAGGGGKKGGGRKKTAAAGDDEEKPLTDADLNMPLPKNLGELAKQRQTVSDLAAQQRKKLLGDQGTPANLGQLGAQINRKGVADRALYATSPIHPGSGAPAGAPPLASLARSAKGLGVVGGVMAAGSAVGGAISANMAQAAPEFHQLGAAVKTMLSPINLFNGKTLEAARSLGQMARSIVESRRQLAPYSGSIAGAFARLDRERIMDVMGQARGTAGTTGFAADQQRMLIQETHDLRKAYANATNILAAALTVGQRMAAAFLRVEPVSRGVMFALEKLNDRLNRNNPDDRAVNAFLKEQQDGFAKKPRNPRPGEFF